MDDWPNSMAGVAERVRGLDSHRSIDAVVARLIGIERAKDGYLNPARRGTFAGSRRLRRRPDGVACFNYMYLRVTDAVRRSLPGFEARADVERLAVVFADYYFTADDAASAGAWISKAWAPLFEKCEEKQIAPLQFALAGMNAHINNDLPWALGQTWYERGGEPPHDSPQYRDFRRINAILAHQQAAVRSTLDSGLLRWFDRALGRVDDIAANVSIERARAEAWERAGRWRRHFDAAAAAAHERAVGFQSHLILAA